MTDKEMIEALRQENQWLRGQQQMHKPLFYAPYQQSKTNKKPKVKPKKDFIISSEVKFWIVIFLLAILSCVIIYKEFSTPNIEIEVEKKRVGGHGKNKKP